MSEAGLQKNTLIALKNLDPVPVDNPRKPGTPDINFIDGWMELKYLPKFPKRADTVIKFPKFRPQQKVWLYKRAHKGGKCFVFVQVEKLFFLFHGGFASQFLGKMTKTQMLNHALKVWDKFPFMELEEAVR